MRGAEADHPRKGQIFLRAVGAQNAGRGMVDPNWLFQNVCAVKQQDAAANLLKSKHIKIQKTGNTKRWQDCGAMVRGWGGGGGSHSLQVEAQTGTITLENSLSVLTKVNTL